MGGYKTQQHRLVHRGRDFHIVSYEGQPADERRLRPEVPASWYLMLSGKRWRVFPEASDVAPEELLRRFGEWLDEHVFGAAGAGLFLESGPAEDLMAAPPPALERRRGPAEA